MDVKQNTVRRPLHVQNQNNKNEDDHNENIIFDCQNEPLISSSHAFNNDSSNVHVHKERIALFYWYRTRIERYFHFWHSYHLDHLEKINSKIKIRWISLVFQTWKKQTVQQRHHQYENEKARGHYEMIIIWKGWYALSKHHEQRILKQRAVSTHRRTVLVQTFQRLEFWTITQLRYKTARVFYDSIHIQKSLVKWREYTMKQEREAWCVNVVKTQKVHSTALNYFQKWQLKLRNRLLHKTTMAASEEHYRIGILTKSLTAFKDNGNIHGIMMDRKRRWMARVLAERWRRWQSYIVQQKQEGEMDAWYMNAAIHRVVRQWKDIIDVQKQHRKNSHEASVLWTLSATSRSIFSWLQKISEKKQHVEKKNLATLQGDRSRLWKFYKAWRTHFHVQASCKIASELFARRRIVHALVRWQTCTRTSLQCKVESELAVEQYVVLRQSTALRSWKRRMMIRRDNNILQERTLLVTSFLASFKCQRAIYKLQQDGTSRRALEKASRFFESNVLSRWHLITQDHRVNSILHQRICQYAYSKQIRRTLQKWQFRTQIRVQIMLKFRHAIMFAAHQSLRKVWTAWTFERNTIQHYSTSTKTIHSRIKRRLLPTALKMWHTWARQKQKATTQRTIATKWSNHQIFKFCWKLWNESTQETVEDTQKCHVAVLYFRCKVLVRLFLKWRVTASHLKYKMQRQVLIQEELSWWKAQLFIARWKQALVHKRERNDIWSIVVQNHSTTWLCKYFQHWQLWLNTSRRLLRQHVQVQRNVQVLQIQGGLQRWRMYTHRQKIFRGEDVITRMHFDHFSKRRSVLSWTRLVIDARQEVSSLKLQAVRWIKTIKLIWHTWRLFSTMKSTDRIHKLQSIKFANTSASSRLVSRWKMHAIQARKLAKAVHHSNVRHRKKTWQRWQHVLAFYDERRIALLKATTHFKQVCKQSAIRHLLANMRKSRRSNCIEGVLLQYSKITFFQRWRKGITKRKSRRELKKMVTLRYTRRLSRQYFAGWFHWVHLIFQERSIQLMRALALHRKSIFKTFLKTWKVFHQNQKILRREMKLHFFARMQHYVKTRHEKKECDILYLQRWQTRNLQKTLVVWKHRRFIFYKVQQNQEIAKRHLSQHTTKSAVKNWKGWSTKHQMFSLMIVSASIKNVTTKLHVSFQAWIVFCRVQVRERSVLQSAVHALKVHRLRRCVREWKNRIDVHVSNKHNVREAKEISSHNETVRTIATWRKYCSTSKSSRHGALQAAHFAQRTRLQHGWLMWTRFKRAQQSGRIMVKKMEDKVQCCFWKEWRLALDGRRQDVQNNNVALQLYQYSLLRLYWKQLEKFIALLHSKRTDFARADVFASRSMRQRSVMHLCYNVTLQEETRQQDNIGDRHHQRHLLSCGLANWRKRMRLFNKQASTCEALVALHRIEICRTGWWEWMYAFSECRHAADGLLQARLHFEFQTFAKRWRMWTTWHNYRRNQENTKLKCDQHRVVVLADRALRCWQMSNKVQVQKRYAVHSANVHRRRTVTTRVFLKWKSFIWLRSRAIQSIQTVLVTYQYRVLASSVLHWQSISRLIGQLQSLQHRRQVRTRLHFWTILKTIMLERQAKKRRIENITADYDRRFLSRTLLAWEARVTSKWLSAQMSIIADTHYDNTRQVSIFKNWKVYCETCREKQRTRVFLRASQSDVLRTSIAKWKDRLRIRKAGEYLYRIKKQEVLLSTFQFWMHYTIQHATTAPVLYGV